MVPSSVSRGRDYKTVHTDGSVTSRAFLQARTGQFLHRQGSSTTLSGTYINRDSAGLCSNLGPSLAPPYLRSAKKGLHCTLLLTELIAIEKALNHILMWGLPSPRHFYGQQKRSCSASQSQPGLLHSPKITGKKFIRTTVYKKLNLHIPGHASKHIHTHTILSITIRTSF